MAYQSANEVCDAYFNNTTTPEVTHYYQGELGIGTIVFSNKAMTTKLPPNKIYGARIPGSNSVYNITLGANSQVIAMNLCTVNPIVPQESTFAVPAIPIGEIRLNSDGSVAFVRSKLQVTETPTALYISDEKWDDINFSERPNETKTVLFAGELLGQARNKPFQNINFEAMRGFDVVAWVGYFATNANSSSHFVNHKIHVGTRPGQNRREWIEGDVKYMFMPTEHVFSTSLLPKWIDTFENFQLPEGIAFASQYEIGNKNMAIALQKGNTHHATANIAQNKRHMYDYDHWWHEAGCPAHADDATREVWLANVDANYLLSIFVSSFATPYSQVGAVIMDGEAYGLASPLPGEAKLDACFKRFKELNPNVKFGWWGRGLMYWNRVQLETGNYKAQLTAALTFAGTFQQFKASISSPIVLGYEVYYENFDILHFGGYTNFPTNKFQIEIALMEEIITAKYFPNKQRMYSFWNLIEYVGTSYLLGSTFFNTQSAGALKYYHKPIVFGHEMWNVGIWFLSRKGCGVDIWDYPHFAIDDDPEHWGWSDGDIRRIATDEALDAKFKAVNGQIQGNQFFDSSTMDWMYAAAKRISQNADIINAATEWTFAETSKDGGNTWTTGTKKLPSETMYDGNALADYKLNSTGTEALVKVYCNYGDALTEKVIKVKIGTKIVDIKVFGRYTSFTRIYNL